MESIEENEKLYKRLVQAEKEKVEFLEKIWKDKCFFVLFGIKKSLIKIVLIRLFDFIYC